MTAVTSDSRLELTGMSGREKSSCMPFSHLVKESLLPKLGTVSPFTARARGMSATAKDLMLNGS